VVFYAPAFLYPDKFLYSSEGHFKDHKDKNYQNKEADENSDKSLPSVQNQTYLKTCGACFVYQHGLLPRES
jgi:hypothetical protein